MLQDLISLISIIFHSIKTNFNSLKSLLETLKLLPRKLNLLWVTNNSKIMKNGPTNSVKMVEKYALKYNYLLINKL